MWTNSSPTSAFAEQTVTLSDDMNNYKYLRFECRLNTSNSSTASFIMSVTDFLSTAGTATDSFILVLQGRAASNKYDMHRDVWYNSANSVYIIGAYQLYGQAHDDSACIPINIYGVK